MTVTPSAAPCSIRFSRSRGKLVQATSRAGPMCWSSLVSRPGRSSRQRAAGRPHQDARLAVPAAGSAGRREAVCTAGLGRRRRLVVLVPEQPGGEPDRAHPVRHRVVDPRDHRDALAGQRQDVEAPQRAGVVEALGEQLPDGAAELLVGERIGVLGLGHVPVEVDLGGLDPGRPAEPEAGFLHSLAEPRKGCPSAHAPARAAAPTESARPAESGATIRTLPVCPLITGDSRRRIWASSGSAALSSLAPCRDHRARGRRCHVRFSR